MRTTIITILTAACFIQAAPLATNPVDFAVFEANNVQVKRFPIDSLVGGVIPHGVTPGTVPKANDDSTFTNSHISENEDTVKVFGLLSRIVTASDSFNRSAIGSNWTTMAGLSAINIQGDTAAHKSADGWCGAYYNAVDSASIQTVSAKMIYNTYTYIAIRAQRSSVTCYAAGWDAANNSIGIYKCISGNRVIITDPPYTIGGDGHTFSLSGKSDTLILYIDGVPIDTAIDAAIPGGWPALIGYRVQAPTYGLWDNWLYIGGADSLLKVNGRVDIENTPTTTTPAFLLAKDAEPDGEIKKIPISAIDSVPYADTAGYALGVGSLPAHGVASYYLPYANGTSTFSDSALMWGNWSYKTGPTLYLGTSILTNPELIIYNNSDVAGSSPGIFFLNGISTYGYANGGARLSYEKLTGYTNSYSRFTLRTYSNFPEALWVDHIAVYEQTGQMVFNDSIKTNIGGWSRNSWYPVWIKHGGFKVSGKAIIDTTPTITTATYALVDYNDTVGNISMSNLYNSMGINDSLITSKVRIGSGGSDVVDVHRRTDTLVIKFSATDSLCFKAVAP